ncbi:MAG: S9 family peptidase [Pseudomonadota bacterium]
MNSSRCPVLFCMLMIMIVGLPSAFASDIEYYGQLPEFRAVTISPDGSHLALLRHKNQEDEVLVMRLADSKVLLSVDASAFKARRLRFVTNKHLLVYGSTIKRIYTQKSEYFGVLMVNIESRESDVLLQRHRNIHEASSSVSRVVGVDAEAEKVYMSAFSKDRAYDLYEVRLKNGRGKKYANGNSHTWDWYLGEKGRILAREDFNDGKHEYKLFSYHSGAAKRIYSCECELPDINVGAVSEDETKLYFSKTTDTETFVHTISLIDGSISKPLIKLQDADVEGFFSGQNRKIRAFISSGFEPNYHFMDDEAAARYESLRAAFPNNAVRYTALTADEKVAIVLVGGSSIPNTYFLFDTEKSEARRLVSQYPKIKDVGEVVAIRYKARDGQSIPAILTWPPGKKDTERLPLIVFPHGGPESHTEIGFDWWAQYFASKGYLVLQPNFRGSSGFGVSFRDAGRGKWGQEMQDDVTDGVIALTKAGYADADRVCIMGASYGGYSALAGGAFSSEHYRCVISVAGFSNLPKMLQREKNDHGSRSWVVTYWNQVMRGSNLTIADLKDVSPSRFAEQFQAPVLLIHGKDDTVVPMYQSTNMARALKKAGKPHQLVTLAGEDHWLSRSETRLSMLKAIDEFLMTHNPPN